MKIKNRKGILMKNVMGIIIAVVGLAVFFAGVYSLYKVNIAQDVENARNTLDNIIGKIELLDEDQENTFVIQGFSGAKNWHLIGWNNDTQPRPDKCFFNNCLCICNPEGDPDRNDRYGKAAFSRQELADACQSAGFCKDVESESIAVASSRTLIAGAPSAAGDILYPSCIVFGKGVNEVFISKKEIDESELWKYGGYGADLLIFNKDFSGENSCVDLHDEDRDDRLNALRILQ